MDEEHSEAKPEQSPWDSLANELGAAPSPDALERKTASKSTQEPSPVSLPPPPPPTPGDWGALASELGLEATPADSASTGEPTSSAEREHARQETEESTADTWVDVECDVADDFEEDSAAAEERDKVLHDSVERSNEPDDSESGERDVVETDDDPAEGNVDETPEKPTLSGEAARSAFDALFAAGSSLFLGDRRKKKAEAAEAAAAEPAAPKEASNPAVDPLANMFDAPPRTVRDEEFAEPSDDDADNRDQETDESSDSPERPKRRRRRRRGKRRDGTDAKGASAADERDADLSLESGSDVAGLDSKDRPARRRSRSRPRADDGESTGESDANGEDFSADEADESSGEGGRRRRTSHRNIPSWSDAIDMIVDSNLATRKANPSRADNSRRRGGGGRSRGGRGRGRKQS